ncbi:MAG TPA: hypothetical protein P5266_03865 [Candidatus Fermentibacter sp.]|nr:hypothetical protein [Candidatus Fermentibacter sp.]
MMNGGRLAPAAALMAACVACGGGEPRAPHLMGSVTVDGIEFGLGGARGSVLNAPRTVYWAGVAMPALVRIDLFGLDVPVDDMGLPPGDAFPSLSLFLPAGPGGDFFTGRPAIPASLEMQLGGVKTFIPESLLVNCSVVLSASPLDTSIVDVALSFSFDRGDSHYEGTYDCPVCFPGVSATEAPAYPSSALPDTLVFTTGGGSLRPLFLAAMREDDAGTDSYTVYAFTEPYTGSVPSKAMQTNLRFGIPVALADGLPVPTRVEALVTAPGDTLVFSAGYAFCWVSAVAEGSVLRGEVQFQGNGSESATRFSGGGPFEAPIK